MYELIKIENTTIGDESVPAVNAKELHEFLGVNTKFNTWIKRRIEECRLLENRDYIWVTQNWETQTSQGKLGLATQKVVILSIDAAKHVAMIERTDKGYEAREYFVECEKKLKALATSNGCCTITTLKRVIHNLLHISQSMGVQNLIRNGHRKEDCLSMRC